MNFGSPQLANSYLSGQNSAVYYDTKRGAVYTPNLSLSMIGVRDLEVATNSQSRKKTNNSNSKSKYKNENENEKPKYLKQKRTRIMPTLPEERRCSATCLSGEKCSLAKLNESEYCRIHENKLNPKESSIKNAEIPVTNSDKCLGKNCIIMGGKRNTRRIKKTKKRTNKQRYK